MKQKILSNWNFMRLIRLGLGIAVFVQAIMAKDVLFALLGLGFMAMPIFNVGCCATGGCDIMPNKKQTTTDITYEEVV